MPMHPDNLALVTQSAFVTAAATASTEIVAANTNKNILLLAVVATTPTATTLEFNDGTNPVTAEFSFGADGGFVMPFNPGGWCRVPEGSPLEITAGAAAANVHITYAEV